MTTTTEKSPIIRIKTQSIKQETKTKEGIQQITFPGPQVFQVEQLTKPNKIGAFRGRIVDQNLPEPIEGRLRDTQKYSTYFNIECVVVEEPKVEKVKKSDVIRKYLAEGHTCYGVTKIMNAEGIKVYFSEVQRVYFQQQDSIE